MRQIDIKQLDTFLDKVYIQHREDIKNLVNLGKFANIVLSVDVVNGKIDSKINITIKRSEII
jgi:hypothetical protein